MEDSGLVHLWFERHKAYLSKGGVGFTPTKEYSGKWPIAQAEIWIEEYKEFEVRLDPAAPDLPPVEKKPEPSAGSDWQEMWTSIESWNSTDNEGEKLEKWQITSLTNWLISEEYILTPVGYSEEEGEKEEDSYDDWRSENESYWEDYD